MWDEGRGLRAALSECQSRGVRQRERSWFSPLPTSLIPHPSSERNPNGDPDLVPDDDEERVEAAQSAWYADVVGTA